MPSEQKFYLESDSISGGRFYFESDNGKIKCRVTDDLLYDLLRKAYKIDAYDGSPDHHLFKYGSKHSSKEASEILNILRKALPELSKNPGISLLDVNCNVPDNELRKRGIDRTLYNSLHSKSKQPSEIRYEASQITTKARVKIIPKGEEGEGNYIVEIPTNIELANLIAFLEACVSSRQGFMVDKPPIDYDEVRKHSNAEITLHYIIQ